MHKALWLHKFIFFHFIEVTFQTKPKKIEMCCLFSFPYQHQFQILTRNKKKNIIKVMIVFTIRTLEVKSKVQSNEILFSLHFLTLR